MVFVVAALAGGFEGVTAQENIAPRTTIPNTLNGAAIDAPTDGPRRISADPFFRNLIGTAGDMGLRNGRVQRHVFGNTPDDITSQLVESQESIDSLLPEAPLQNLRDYWEGLNRHLRESCALDLGLNETILYQQAASGTHPRGAASDDIDFFGEWEPYSGGGRGAPGFFAFSSEIRNRYSQIAPSQLGSQIGSVYDTTVGFNSEDFTLVQLYWEHGSIESGRRYRIGRMDPGLIYDGGRYVSSNYAFLSPAFSDTPAMSVPAAGLGFAGAFYPSENTYLLLGVHDANARRTTAGWNSFFNEGEYFTAIEFGVFPSEGDDVRGLWHMTFWHVDARSDKGMPSDHGLALTVEQSVGDRGNLVPWMRYSYANRGLNPIRQNLAFGVGVEDVLGKNEDLIGIGFGWGMPSDRSLRDEYILEWFYRIVVTPHTHITPDFQVIINPANALNHDSVSVLGLRLRTLF